MASHRHNGYDHGTVDLTRVATCVGCGCTDREGCLEGCTWLAVDRRDLTGVCSSCPDALEAWKKSHQPTSRRS